MQRALEPTSDPVYQTVLWFSDTTVSRNEQLARKVAAIVLAIFLTFTIIGIYYVLKGIRIWSQLSPGIAIIEHPFFRETYPPQNQNEDLFPEPYQKLREMGLNNERDLEPIRQMLRRARTQGNNTLFPRCYPELVEAVGSEEKARKLFDEGLILIHYICVREYNGIQIHPFDYQKFVIPYMDMLFSYLLENQRFPVNIYEGWALD